MQDPNEIEKINKFLNIVAPILTKQVILTIQESGLKVTECGRGPDQVFVIKRGDKEIKFFTYNLFLETATIDRDEEPLRFDERLKDVGYFMAKSAELARSKLQIRYQLLTEDNVDTAIDNISENATGYERIRILKFDTKEQSSNRQQK